MNNFRAASILSKVTLSKDDAEQIAVFINTIAKNGDLENEFFNYCSKWKLAPWIYTQMNRLGLAQRLSKETIKLFEDAHTKITNDNERRNAEAVRFLKEFKKHNIEVVILKGNLFAHTIYKDPGYKRMNDFDILIHMEDWDKIQEIYFSLGYIPLGFGWSGEKQKAAKFSHVGMSFISQDFSCIIGSQWGLKSPTTQYKVNIDEAWKTAVPFDFYGVSVKQLSPEYNLLHLILHMGIYKCGIRDCMDVYNYLLIEKIDEQEFHGLISKTRAIDKTAFTIKLCDICSGTLGALSASIKPENSFITRRLNKRLIAFQESGDFQNSYNDYFQDIEKIVIYFNLFPAFHKKLLFYFIVLKFVFFPKKSVALKFIDRSEQGSVINILKARVAAPYFVFSLIAQEIGWKFTFLLFLKLFFDLILSLKNYVIKKESYFDYLKSRGIDPKAIEKAVKNIQ